jgi:hypothetical protein
MVCQEGSDKLTPPADTFNVQGRYLSDGCEVPDKTKITVRVTLFLCLIEHHVMKTYGEVEVYLHTFSTSILDENVSFTPRLLELRAKRPWYLFNRSCSRHDGEKKISALPRNQTQFSDSLSCSLDTVLNESL